MIDLRDNHQYSYSTYNTGGPMKMWMTQNLNYGTVINSSTPQTDNCIAEKYCPPSDPTCAGAGGGYYQWDELMSFQGNSGDQDLCPPGWHVPSDAEWQALIDNFDPAFPGAIANAIIGDEMKDQAKTFKAKLEGINYMNSNPAWSFTTTPAATMFWTSTPDANGKIIARGLNSPYNISISKYASSAANAFSVRCVRE